jgi:hypothetical protein
MRVAREGQMKRSWPSAAGEFFRVFKDEPLTLEVEFDEDTRVASASSWFTSGPLLWQVPAIPSNNTTATTATATPTSLSLFMVVPPVVVGVGGERTAEARRGAKPPAPAAESRQRERSSWRATS